MIDTNDIHEFLIIYKISLIILKMFPWTDGFIDVLWSVLQLLYFKI